MKQRLKTNSLNKKLCQAEVWRVSVPAPVEMVHWTSELNVKLNTVCVETNINTVYKTPLKNTVTSNVEYRGYLGRYLG